LDWLSLIILLDQMPRNSFRGSKAGIAFNIFDPRALDIALQAIAAGITETPQIRYRLAYRFWFYLPLQHSEDPKIQERSMREHEQMFRDLQTLVNETEPGRETGGTHGEEALECSRVLRANRDGVDGWATMLMGVVKKHKDIVDRFGRYPHRNQALGRDSTEEETQFLAEGGDTFGGSTTEK
jgi:uncharacterized protein (DUF924 family)